MSVPKRVGVRELRQNLSVYLRRVKQGETLEVTERGQPVARLTPPSSGIPWLDEEIAAGRIRPAARRFEDLPPPKPLPPGGPTLSEILDEMREEDRRRGY